MGRSSSGVPGDHNPGSEKPESHRSADAEDRDWNGAHDNKITNTGRDETAPNPDKTSPPRGLLQRHFHLFAFTLERAASNGRFADNVQADAAP